MHLSKGSKLTCRSLQSVLQVCITYKEKFELQSMYLWCQQSKYICDIPKICCVFSTYYSCQTNVLLKAIQNINRILILL